MHNVRIPFHKLDITTDPEEIYKYLIIKELHAFISINPKVAEIAKAILKVEDGEEFSDFMSGTALTTEIITEGKDVETCLSDNFPHAFALSTLYLFLTNKKRKVPHEGVV